MAAYEGFETFSQGQRTRLVRADVEAVARGKHNFSGLAAEAKAAAFVWTAAALEAFMSAFIRESFESINTYTLVASDVRHSLFSAISEKDFHVIRSSELRATWSARLAVVLRPQGGEPITIEGEGPLDGKTIRAYHFEAMWATFGLDGTPWPSPVHRTVLEDLANSRNDVAHGGVSPVAFGRGRTFDDCLKMLSRIDDLVLNAVIEMDDYIKTEAFKR